MKTILVDAVFTFVSEKGVINKSLYNLLEKYPNKKIILTNANDEQTLSYKLDKIPYELFTLKHNPDKIDPEYFIKMLRHYNLKARDVIYFEHDSDAVKSARSVKITSYLYDPNKKDLKALKVFFDSNL